MHEVLGHGSTIAYIPGEVYCDVARGYISMDKDGIPISAGRLGDFSMESIADVIACYAFNQKVSYDMADYTAETYAFATLCKSSGCSIDDFIDNGMEQLTDCMNKSGIRDPYTTLLKLDYEHYYMQDGAAIDINEAYNNILMEYFGEIAANKIYKGENICSVKQWASESLEAYNDIVDVDYENDSKVLLVNLGKKTYTIKPDDIQVNVLNIIDKIKEVHRNSVEQHEEELEE